MKMIELICEECGATFYRSKGEVTRNKKLNRSIYCSLKCCGKNSKIYLEGKMVPHPEKLVAGNRLDYLSPFKMYVITATRRSSGGYQCQNEDKALELGVCGITAEYLKELWDNQKGLCALTGLKMELLPTTLAWNNAKINPWRASLDRIDRFKGYIPGNVRFVCQIVNIALSKYTDKDLLIMSEALVHANNIRKELDCWDYSI